MKHAVSGTLVVLVATLLAPSCARQPKVTPQEARSIAKEAYVWAYPMVENYKVMYVYSVYKAPDNPEYKAPFNVISNTARVFTPADSTVQTPNSDTPYSMVWIDLRAEPVVITVPDVEPGRYYSAPVHRPIYLQLRLHRDARDWKQGRELSHCGTGLEGDCPRRRCEGDPV